MIMLRFECGSWNSNLRWFLFKVCMKNFGHSNVKFVKLIFFFFYSCEYTKCQFMKGHDRLVVKFVVKLIQQQVSISSLRDHSSITSLKRWVGGVRKWQFLMIYSTVNHQRVGWVGLKKSKTWWRNTWMPPYRVNSLVFLNI